MNTVNKQMNQKKGLLLQRVLAILVIVAIMLQQLPAIPVSAAKKMTMNKSSKTLYLNEDNLTNTSDTYDFGIKNKGTNYKSKYKFTWYAEDDSIVNVAKGGVVTARKVGTTTVKCDVIKKSNGKLYQTVSAKVTVKANAKTVTIKNAPEGNKMEVGNSFDFNRTMKDANGRNATDKTEWLVSDDKEGTNLTNEEAASINNSGVFTPKIRGTYYIIAKTYQSAATKKEGYTAVSEPVEIKAYSCIKSLTLLSSKSIKVEFEGAGDLSGLKVLDYMVTRTDSGLRQYVKSAKILSDNKSVCLEFYNNLENQKSYTVSALDANEKTIDVVIGEVNSFQIKGYLNMEGTAVLLEGKMLDSNGVDVTELNKNTFQFYCNFMNKEDCTWDDLMGFHELPDSYRARSNDTIDEPSSSPSATPEVDPEIFIIVNDGSDGQNIPLTKKVTIYDGESFFENCKPHDIFCGDRLTPLTGISDKADDLTYTYYTLTNDDYTSMKEGEVPTKAGDYGVRIFAKSTSLDRMEESEIVPFSINKKDNTVKINKAMVICTDEGKYKLNVDCTATYGAPTYTCTPINGKLDSEGVPCEAGTYKVTATVEETDIYKVGKDSTEFTLPETLFTKVASDEDGLVINVGGVLKGSQSQGNINVSDLQLSDNTNILVNLFAPTLNSFTFNLSDRLTVNKGQDLALNIPVNVSIAELKGEINGTLSLLGSGNVKLSDLIVSSPDSLYIDGVKIIPSEDNSSVLKTTGEGHIVFSDLQSGSKVNLQMDGTNDLVEIGTEQASMVQVNGQQSDAALTYSDGVKDSYFGSFARVLDTVKENLDSESSATITVNEDVTITKDTVIPANVKLIIKDGVKLNVAKGVTFSYEKDTSDSSDSPHTGDNMPVILLSVLLLLSIGGIGAVQFHRRKYNR